MTSIELTRKPNLLSAGQGFQFEQNSFRGRNKWGNPDKSNVKRGSGRRHGSSSLADLERSLIKVSAHVDGDQSRRNGCLYNDVHVGNWMATADAMGAAFVGLIAAD